jgi:hypothetical protein
MNLLDWNFSHFRPNGTHCKCQIQPKTNNIDPNCEPLHAALRKSYPKLAWRPRAYRKLFLQEYFPLPEPTFVTHIDCLSTIITWMWKHKRNQIRGAPWLILEAGGWITKVEGLMTQSGGWRLDYKIFCQISFYISNSKKKSSDRKRLRKNCLSEKKKFGPKDWQIKVWVWHHLVLPVLCVSVHVYMCLTSQHQTLSACNLHRSSQGSSPWPVQHICMFTVTVCHRLPSPCPTFGFNKFYGASSVLCVCRTSQHQALFACNLHRSSQGHALDQSDLSLWGLGIETLIYHCASTSTAQPSDNALQRHKRHKRHKSWRPHHIFII